MTRRGRGEVLRERTPLTAMRSSPGSADASLETTVATQRSLPDPRHRGDTHDQALPMKET